MTEWKHLDKLMLVSIIHTCDFLIQVMLVIIVYTNEEGLTLSVENLRSLKNGILSMSLFDKFITEIGECTYVLDNRIMCNDKDRYEKSYLISKSLQDFRIDIFLYCLRTYSEYNGYITIKKMTDLWDDNNNHLLIENTNHRNTCFFYNRGIAGDRFKSRYIYSIAYIYHKGLETEVMICDKQSNAGISSQDKGNWIITTNYSMMLVKSLVFHLALFILESCNYILVMDYNEIYVGLDTMFRRSELFGTFGSSNHTLNEIKFLIDLDRCNQKTNRGIAGDRFKGRYIYSIAYIYHKGLETEVMICDKQSNAGISSQDKGNWIITTNYSMMLVKSLVFHLALFILESCNYILVMDYNEIYVGLDTMFRLLELFGTFGGSNHTLNEIKFLIDLDRCNQKTSHPIVETDQDYKNVWAKYVIQDGTLMMVFMGNIFKCIYEPKYISYRVQLGVYYLREIDEISGDYSFQLKDIYTLVYTTYAKFFMDFIPNIISIMEDILHSKPNRKCNKGFILRTLLLHVFSAIGGMR